MELRSLLKSGPSLALGALALGAVGTFTQPMPDGTGGAITPTGNAFALDMITVGIWNRQGTIDEEFVFWDGRTLYQKIGLA